MSLFDRDPPCPPGTNPKLWSKCLALTKQSRREKSLLGRACAWPRRTLKVLLYRLSDFADKI